MTRLTLIDGARRRTFTEHPMETAKRALLDAAELEAESWAGICRRLASALPDRVAAWEGMLKREEREERWNRRMEESRKAKNAWRRLSPAARESLALRVLGDERLIVPELTSRLNAELGYPDGADESGCRSASPVYVSHVRNLVTRMHRVGQLERVPECFMVNHVRYRYFRKRALEGPIAELKRAYQDDQEGGA